MRTVNILESEETAWVPKKNTSRRHILQLLAAMLSPMTQARSASPNGTALLLEIRSRRMLKVDGAEVARRFVTAPGSTVKPFTLLALLQADKLKSDDQYFCTRHLRVNGHVLDCSHPLTTLPMNPARAIAYSCNCAVAHFAERFGPGDLSDALRRFGLTAQTGLLPGGEASGFVSADETGPEDISRALGQAGIRTTPLEMLAAYRRLALRAHEAQMAPILEGLEGAVEFGTAQAAKLERIRVAGKTGSIVTGGGLHVAWFAGFAPSRAPEVAVTVMLQGHSGGAAAAPIAGKLLREYFADKT